MHICLRSDDITKSQIDIEVTKSEVMVIKDDIKEIRTSIDKGNERIISLLYWLIGFIGTSLLTLIGFILSRGGKL